MSDVHVIPMGDEPKHEESSECWCVPSWDAENQRDFELGVADKKVWVHNRKGYQ